MPQSTLGVGWVLSAGGYISRTVNGIPDEKVGTKNNGTDNKIGYYYNHTKSFIGRQNSEMIQNGTLYKNVEKYLENFYADEGYELCPDEFTFNFLGYAGTFLMGEDGKWKVISDTNIKVEFDENTGFSTNRDLMSRFRYMKCDGDIFDSNKIFFKKFTLITPDGTRYEFGGEHAVEYSVPYYSQTTDNLVASCWKLSKIVTVDNHEAIFEYKDDSYSCDIHYSPQFRTTSINWKEIRIQHNNSILNNLYDILCGPLDGFADKWLVAKNKDYYSDAQYDYAKTGLSGNLSMPCTLTKISTASGSVEFCYRFDTGGLRYMDNVNCLYWDSPDEHARRTNFYKYDRQLADKKINFFRFLNINPAFGASPAEIRNSICSKLNGNILSKIIVDVSSEKFDVLFDWKIQSYRHLLSEISVVNIPNLKSETFIVAPDQKKDSSTHQIVFNYKFSYWNEKDTSYMWPKWNTCLTFTDSWGYFKSNGNNGEKNGNNNGGTSSNPIRFGSGPSRDNVVMDRYEDPNPNKIQEEEYIKYVESRERTLVDNTPERDSEQIKDKTTPGLWDFGLKYGPGDYVLQEPVLNSTLTFALKTITYPTGCKTSLDYELNDYSKVFLKIKNNQIKKEEFSGKPYTGEEETDTIPESQNELVYDRTAGGLRVKEINMWDPEGTSKTIKYRYIGEDGCSSGVLYQEPCFHDCIELVEQSGIAYVDIYAFNSLYKYNMNLNSPAIGYSTVVEEVIGEKGKSVIKTKSKYLNYDKIDSNIESFFKYGCSGESTTLPYTQFNFELGKLLSKEVYDNDRVLQSSKFRYIRNGGKMLPVLGQDYITFKIDYEGNMSWLPRCYAYYVATDRFLTERVEEIMVYDEDSVKTVTEYAYDDKNMVVKQKKSRGADCETLEINYTYNDEKYKYLTDQNIIYPICNSTSFENSMIKEKMEYAKTWNDIPYMSKQVTEYHYGDKKNVEEVITEVVQTDMCGFPSELIYKGINYVIQWDYNSCSPEIIIRGAKLEDIVRICGIGRLNVNNINMYVAEIREKMPYLQICEYQYCGYKLTNEKKENGMELLYSYDKLGRLIEASFRTPTSKQSLTNKYMYMYETQSFK